MARLHHGLLGATTGRVGNIVAERWKSINYIRQLGENEKPRSEAQNSHAEKYGLANECYKILANSIIKDVIACQPNKKLTPQQAFIKMMLKEGMKKTLPIGSTQTTLPFKAELRKVVMATVSSPMYNYKVSNTQMFQPTDLLNCVANYKGNNTKYIILLRQPLTSLTGIISPPAQTPYYSYIWICRTKDKTPSGRVVATSPVLQVHNGTMPNYPIPTTLVEAILAHCFN